MRHLLPALATSALSFLIMASGFPVRQSRGEGSEAKPTADLPPAQSEGPAIRLPLTPKKLGVITGLAFSPDGKTLAASSGEAVVRFYDPVTARERRPAWDSGSKEAIRGMAYSPDGALLAFGNLHRVILLDTATGRPRITLQIPPPPKPQNVAIQTVAYAPDGRSVAAAGYNGQIEVWDVATGRVQAVMQGPIVPYPRPMPDGKVRGRPAHIRALAYSPDGKTLTSAGVDSVVRFWDPATGQERSNLDALDAGDLIKAKYGEPLAYSSDGAILATGARIIPATEARIMPPPPKRPEELVILWDTATWKQRIVLRGYTEYATDMRFLPGNKTLASLDGEKMVRLWDVATGRQLDALRFESHSYMSRLAVSPDGKLLAAGGYVSDAMFGAIELIETDGTLLRHRGPRR